MIKFGVTFSPEIKEEVLNLPLDFLEIKNLREEFLVSNSGIFERFSGKTMHVQYFSSSKQNKKTFNIASNEARKMLENKSSTFYKALRILNPFAISFHLGFSCAEVGVEGLDNHNFAKGRVFSREETSQRIVSFLKMALQELPTRGFKGKILVENLDYHSTGAYEYVCEPEFISHVAEATGSSILLDIGHTLISSANLKLAPLDFIRRLSLERVYEVHVNAPLHKDNIWHNTNEPFYSLRESRELIRFILKEKKRKKQFLLINIEVDKEIKEQLALLKTLAEK